MSTLSDLSDMLNDTVQVSTVTNADDYGKKTYSAATSYKARVVNKVRKITDYKGDEVISTAEAWILGLSTLDPATTIVTLPNGNTPQIANVMEWPSEVPGDVSVKVYFL